MRMQPALTLLVVAVICAPQPHARQASQESRPPTFRSAVELTALDVTVVDGSGRPVKDLTANDFTVRVNGKSRGVARVEWVPLVKSEIAPTLPQPPDGYSSNLGSTGGRLIIVAIDQPNIRSEGAMGLRETVNAFLDRLEPSDRVAAVALGGGVSTPFTTNRAVVKEAISRMSGEMRFVSDIGTSNLSATEAIDIADGSQSSLSSVLGRECRGSSGGGGGGGGGGGRGAISGCMSEVLANARAITSSLKQETSRTIASLQGLLAGLRLTEPPKTIVLVSEGFTVDSPGALSLLSSLAADARATIYALKLDDRTFEASVKRMSPARTSDRDVRYAGLETLTSDAKGGVFDVIGKGSVAFQRLEQEIAGYYLIGVDSMPTDKDGKEHPISVRVSRGGAIVRARHELARAGFARPRAPRPVESVSAALNSPLITTGLPLQVATFSMRDEDPTKIQVLIHVDIGSGYTSVKDVALGYLISDSKGNVVVRQTGDGRLAPPGGVPASLGYTVGASLPPGEYELKFAVTEGGRTGSIEHPIHAALTDAGGLALSELMIGGPVDSLNPMRPTIGYDVNFGEVQGYVEAYGTAENLMKLVVHYEVAPALDAPALASAAVPGRLAGVDRTVFSHIMPVYELPAGQYYLRASLSTGSGGTPLKRVARMFRVPDGPGAPRVTPAAPRVTPAAIPPAAAPSPAPVAAVVTPLARPFRRDDVVQSETLQRFRNIVTAVARQDFEAGVVALAAGDFEKAERSFKSAQRAGSINANGTAPLTYLAATYAASGHDLEAANVWQTALIDGSAYPQIYEWLTEALIRVRNLEQARGTLKEALEKWPNDSRFILRLSELERAQGRR